MSKKNYLVFGAESQSYQTRSGDTVSKFIIHYVDPANCITNRLESGCMPLQKDIISAGEVDSSQFPIFPGYYELNFRGYSQRVGRDTKASQKLMSASFLKEFSLPKCSISDEAYLLIYAKHFDLVIDGKRVVGSKLFFLDPEQLTDFGYQVISLSCTSSAFNVRSVLDVAPGYYLFDVEESRGQGGDALFKLSSLEFVESVDLSYIVSSSSGSGASFSYASS